MTDEAKAREAFEAWHRSEYPDQPVVFDHAWVAWNARAASPDPMDVGHLRSRFMAWLQHGCAPVDAFDKTMKVITERASPDPAPVCKMCKGEGVVPLSRQGAWKPCPDCADPASVKGAVAWLRDQRGTYEGPATFSPMVLFAEPHPDWHKYGATYSPVFTHPAGMSEDAERLDWIVSLSPQMFYEGGGGWYCETSDGIGHGATPRAAIDRARRALAGEGK